MDELMRRIAFHALRNACFTVLLVPAQKQLLVQFVEVGVVALGAEDRVGSGSVVGGVDAGAEHDMAVARPDRPLAVFVCVAGPVRDRAVSARFLEVRRLRQAGS